MAEQGGDGVEAHAAVDGLGGQGVAQLVGGDVADPCVGAEPAQCRGDPQRGDGPVAFEQEPVGAQPVGRWWVIQSSSSSLSCGCSGM